MAKNSCFRTPAAAAVVRAVSEIRGAELPIAVVEPGANPESRFAAGACGFDLSAVAVQVAEKFQKQRRKSGNIRVFPVVVPYIADSTCSHPP